MDLHTKVALVTGGATGIGKAISLHLASLGYQVAIVYNSSAQAADELVSSLVAKGLQAKAFKANVSSFNETKNLVDQIITEYGRLDVLVNNAGITADNLMLRMSEAQFDDVIQTNLKGVWNLCKHALRPMMKASSGRIINISSVSGVMGLAGQSNYSAAKAGVLGLTKSLAREVASRGITVNAVAPGYIQTAMTLKLSEEINELARKSIPLGRFGTPEDVAAAVAFLASEAAGYITGHTLEVDGGLAMV